MKKLLQYLPFHFLLCLIIGILLQFHTSIWHFDSNYLILILLLFSVSLFLLKKNIAGKVYYTVITQFFFVFLGISTTFIHNPKNRENYYEYHITKNSGAILRIHKVLKSGYYAHKYIADIIQIDTKKTTGNVLINIKKDSILKTLKVDDKIFINADFKELSPALNPYQFDYKNYLAKKHVHQQVFLNRKTYKKVPKSRPSIYGLSAQFRHKIQTSLKNYNFTKNQLSVINALLLGQRKNISKNLIESYKNAGAIHILAISGLHIGIILLMLSYLFKPIERFKNGLLIKMILVIILLWMFAFIAGLSASVVRAVTMFTFVAVGTSFKRKKIVEYSLISSMLFLLLLKPLFLFDVGFQMSYMAIFGIIWVQPLLYKLWNPELWILNKFWSLISVSIAAQIGIVPISLYYFHQFPGLFFIANLLIIPFLGGVLMGGILIIILALLNVDFQILFDIYGFIISLMNSIVDWVSKQEQFLLQEISMSFHEMILWYFFIIFTYQFVINSKTKQLLFLFTAVILLQVTFIFDKKNKQTKQEFIVFHKSRKNLMAIRNGTNLQVLHNLDSSKIAKERAIKGYRIQENIQSTFSSKIPTIFAYASDTILIVNRLGVYDISLKNPIVILQNSPKINLIRLIKKLNPKQIIADGSNYNSYIKNWKATCKQQKIPFHYTKKNGAFRYP